MSTFFVYVKFVKVTLNTERRPKEIYSCWSRKLFNQARLLDWRLDWRLLSRLLSRLSASISAGFKICISGDFLVQQQLELRRAMIDIECFPRKLWNISSNLERQYGHVQFISHQFSKHKKKHFRMCLDFSSVWSRHIPRNPLSNSNTTLFSAIFNAIGSHKHDLGWFSISFLNIFAFLKFFAFERKE